MFCKQCGKPIDDGQELCEDCAKNANAQQATQNTTSNSSTVTPESKSKLAAGLLGIFLGGWGIHNFYRFYWKRYCSNYCNYCYLWNW